MWGYEPVIHHPDSVSTAEAEYLLKSISISSTVSHPPVSDKREHEEMSPLLDVPPQRRRPLGVILPTYPWYSSCGKDGGVQLATVKEGRLKAKVLETLSVPRPLPIPEPIRSISKYEEYCYGSLKTKIIYIVEIYENKNNLGKIRSSHMIQCSKMVNSNFTEFGLTSKLCRISPGTRTSFQNCLKGLWIPLKCTKSPYRITVNPVVSDWSNFLCFPWVLPP